MKTETYTIEIPQALVDHEGTVKTRILVRAYVQTAFEDWAKESLLDRIKVTKPHTKTTE